MSQQSYPSHPPGQYGGQPPMQETNTLAIVGLVLSIIGLVGAGIITAIPGVILGYKARRQIEEGRSGGGGLATAAIWIGWVAIILTVLAIVAVIAIFIIAAVASSA